MRRSKLYGGMLAATATGLLIGSAAMAQQPNRVRGNANIGAGTGANLNLGTRGNQQGARINGRVNAGNRASGHVGVGVRAGTNGVGINGRQRSGFRGNRGNWRGQNGVGVGVYIGGGRRSSYYRNPGYNGYYSNRMYYPNNNAFYGNNYSTYGGSYYTGSSHAGYSSGPCASGVQHHGYVQGGQSQGYQESGERYEAARPAFGGRLPAQRPGFGVSFDDTANGVVRIARVYPNSPAARAGLQVGDVLVGLNGQQIRGDWQRTVSQIRGMNPGDELDLTIQRDGEEQELNAELATWDEAFAARDQQAGEDDAPPAPDADLNDTNPADMTEPMDPTERTIPSTPDASDLKNEADTPDQPKKADKPIDSAEPKLNEKADEAASDIDAKTPATKPKNPKLPTLPDPEVDAPESATESIDQP